MEHDDRIDKTKERGVHISLRCKNHPNLRWSTKNIGWIGARSIFFASSNFPTRPEWVLNILFANRYGDGDYANPQDIIHDLTTDGSSGRPLCVVECACPVSDLVVLI